MNISHGLIGFGEVGSGFATAADWGQTVRAYDIRPVDFKHVKGCASLAEAVSNAPVIISVVTAESAVDVACDTARYIRPGAYFFDMNSVSPDSKKAAARPIEAAGGHYVDTAVMAPVNPQYMAVPLLLAGPQAAAGEAILSKLSFTNMRVVGDDVGRAATIKMLRSVMYKGVEALTAECLLACERAGVTEEVLASFGNDWSDNADYRFDRMLVHGLRRAAEMAESVKTLSEMGVEPLMTRGTVEWQRRIGALNLNAPPAGLDAKLKKLSEL